MALGREDESLAEFIDRMTNDPDSVRREWEADMLEERGQEWFDQEKQYFDAMWDVVLEMHFGSDNVEANRRKA